MPVIEFAGTASVSMFTGPLDVPEGTDPEEWARSEEGRKQITDAFAEFWYNNGWKLRDFDLKVTDYQIQEPDVDPDNMLDWGRKLKEIIEL